MHARHANPQQRRYQHITILSIAVILMTMLAVVASYVYAPSMEETNTPAGPIPVGPVPTTSGKSKTPTTNPTTNPTTRLVSHLLTPPWIKSPARFVKPTTPRPPAKPTVPLPSKAESVVPTTAPASSKPTRAPSSDPTSAPTSVPSSTATAAPSSAPTSNPVTPTPAGTPTPTVTPSSADPAMLPKAASAVPASITRRRLPSCLPVARPYRLSQGYSARHRGLDFAAPRGRLVRNATWGKVIAVRRLSGSYGTHVLVRHGNGQVTLYAHLSSTHLRAGMSLAACWTIGRLGSTGNSTGPHLHFEVQNGYGAQINPTPWLTARGVRP